MTILICINFVLGHFLIGLIKKLIKADLPEKQFAQFFTPFPSKHYKSTYYYSIFLSNVKIFMVDTRQHQRSIIIYYFRYQIQLHTICNVFFPSRCGEALKKNKKLITPDQKEYQHELEKNYQKFEAHLSPLFSLNPTRPQTSSPQ